MAKFNFQKWLLRKTKEEPKIYQWDKAATSVMNRIRETGEHPIGAFSAAWGMGDYDRPDPHCVGYVVLFTDRFWLMPRIIWDEPQVTEFKGEVVSQIEVLDVEDPANWRMYNLSINRGWLRLALWPPRHGGQEAYALFRKFC